MPRRLVRIIPHIIAVALSMTCMAILVLWARGYRSTAPAALASEPMQDRLARVGADVSLRNMPLHEAVWFLQDAGFALGGEADIDLNVPSLRAAGISPDVPVTIEGKDVPLGLAVVRVASAAGADCWANNELVHVCSKAHARPLRPFERPPDARDPSAVRLSSLLARARGAAPLSISQTTLGHALHKLGESAGMTFVIDRAPLKSAGIDGDTPVSVTTRNATAGNMLALILRNASPRVPLQFRAQGGVVRISTRDQFDAEDRPARMLRALVAVAIAIVAIVLVWMMRSRIKALATQMRPYLIPVSVILLIGIIAVVVACASRPIGIIALFRRVTMDSFHGDLNLWVSPADPISPYRQRDAGTRARTLTPLRRVPIATVKSLPGLSVSHRPWPHEVSLIRARCAAAAALSGGFPLIWFPWHGYTRLKLRRRKKFGHCLVCGYDLRGSAGARCPECGSSIPARNLESIA